VVHRAVVSAEQKLCRGLQSVTEAGYACIVAQTRFPIRAGAQNTYICTYTHAHLGGPARAKLRSLLSRRPYLTARAYMQLVPALPRCEGAVVTCSIDLYIIRVVISCTIK